MLDVLLSGRVCWLIIVFLHHGRVEADLIEPDLVVTQVWRWLPVSSEEDDDEPADPATEENIKQAQQNAQMNVDLNPDSSSSDDEAAVMQQIQEQKKKKQGKKDQPKKEQVKSAPPAKKAPPRKESSSSSDEAPPAKPAAPA